MNIVIVGHVDHGKSTLVGRLLVDTNSLPQGKLDQVRKNCEINSKPFEYAFLLDALVDEQDQGITIDTARIFFKTNKRDYIIIDAPGHIEFLKNMISGASRAEAAILLIDAEEGIAENSKRHGYMLSMLGIKQVAVAVNKMDLIDYNEKKFNKIKIDYTRFLKDINITPREFIPVSARNGINLTDISQLTSWYNGPTIIDVIDSFKSNDDEIKKPFRMFTQGTYKFAEFGNDKRVIAGTVNTGQLKVGDKIIFYPSLKESSVDSIEEFAAENKQIISAGMATGISLNEQVYLPPSELVCKVGEHQPIVSNRFRANIFWMGKSNLVENKKYQLKIGTKTISFFIEKIEKVLNTSDLVYSKNSREVFRNEAAECIIETQKPISFDLVEQNEATSKFVIVDDYDIAGGGIITQNISEFPLHQINKKGSFEIELNQLIQKYYPAINKKAIYKSLISELEK